MGSTWVWTVIFALLGAAVGSFLNVCISRIPQGLSIVSPSSRCPLCGHPIRFYDNLPILGYLLLGGKCRDCGGKIAFRYPLVETLTAALAVLLFLRYGLTPAYPVVSLFVCTLVVIAFIDLDHQIIPDILTLGGIPVFAVLSVLIMALSPLDAFLGIMVGAGILYFVAVYYEALTGREGMGLGDVHLLAMIGGFLGWKSLLAILLAASLLGTVVGLAVMAGSGRGFRSPLPFGPFICAAAVLYLFFADCLAGTLLSVG